jgi:hypothetical protein
MRAISAAAGLAGLLAGAAALACAAKPEAEAGGYDSKRWVACVQCIREHSDRDDAYSVAAAREGACQSLCQGLRAEDGSRPGEQGWENLENE